jgi:hypothetical protein
MVVGKGLRRLIRLSGLAVTRMQMHDRRARFPASPAAVAVDHLLI